MFFFFLFFLAAPLHVGCYAEQSSNREFVVSAGNYNNSQLDPGLCVRLCGALSYMYSALQNGNFCLCGNVYGSFGRSDTCNKPCSGDVKTLCGGEMANNVYNSTPFIGNFVITEPQKPFILFNQENLAATYTNGTVSDPGLAVDVGEDTGFSDIVSISTKFVYQPTKWGTRTVTAKNSVAKDFNKATCKVKVASQVKHLKVHCPQFVETSKVFQCKAWVFRGTDMIVEWRLAEGSPRNQTLPGEILFFNFYLFMALCSG